MEQSELYQLPKDILIKLLADVQQELKEKADELKEEVDMYKDILDHTYKGIRTTTDPGESYVICSKKGCTHYAIEDGYQTAHLTHCCCEDYNCSKKCDQEDYMNWWCEYHLKEGELEKVYKTIHACSFCKKNCGYQYFVY